MITVTVIARSAQETTAVPKSTIGARLVTPEREVKMTVQSLQLAVQLSACDNPAICNFLNNMFLKKTVICPYSICIVIYSNLTVY